MGRFLQHESVRGFRESYGLREESESESESVKISGFRESDGLPEVLLDEPRRYCGSGRYDKILERLISSMRSKCLVRNNGDLVDIKSLEGKLVGLVFMSLPPPPEQKSALRECIRDIASAYDELSKSKKGKFEIVLIAQGECESVFNEYLKMMPWPAVPFIDSTTRNLLYSDLAQDIKPKKGWDITLFDGNGKLLRKGASYLFGAYGPGADGYPFTDKRLEEIRDEDDATRANMSLKNLLGNPTRDFVLGNKGGKVRISCLEDMVVGLYFCDVVCPGYGRALFQVYSELKAKGEMFEVVMVPAGGWLSEDYLEQVKRLPWLALPIDSNCKRLVRLFNPLHEPDNKLVIIGPGAGFVNKLGSLILNYYGIDAYPFSRLSLAERVKTRLEEVRVRSLLTCGDENYVMSRSGEKILVSDILGKKTIVLLYTGYGWWSMGGFEQQLMKWYDDVKRTEAEFEVIFVGAGCEDDSSFDKEYLEMPWLALPFKDSRTDSWESAMQMGSSSIFPTISVFGPSGRLVSMQPKGDFDVKGSGDLVRDVYLVLAKFHSWPLEYDDKGKGPLLRWF